VAGCSGGDRRVLPRNVAVVPAAPVEHEHRVTPRELFFDLVFVFAFTQVSELLAHEPTFTGIGHGVLVLAALWWPWTAYAWLTNTIDPEEGFVGAALLAALIAMFLAAIAVPAAFGDEGVLFGGALLVVVALHLGLYALAGRGHPDLLHAVLRLAPWSLLGAGLILVAGLVDTARVWFWLAALACTYVGAALAGVAGWRIHPSHLTERYGLVLIIALGEAFIAIGIGASGRIGFREAVSAVLALLVAAAFWLAYFDFFSIRGEQLLAGTRGPDRIALARDVYAYGHLPMIVGIVLFAFATKRIMAHVDRDFDAPTAFALCGGCALYLLSYVGIRVRIERRLSRGRLVAAIVLLALLLVATAVPALAALALVTAVWVALHAYELVFWRRARAESRSSLASA
jgi:low temperature requirement protein LtrA